MELKGKTILITGGASGIGLEAAKRFQKSELKSSSQAGINRD
ncbi:hypothetical protein OMO38_10120 [Chryseobacterium sp. 09-1422]|uniref:Short-chain dehydrogenase n=1 Tax=Chryseobacterium kimseyorum TaxID=2984028 RepID=A0ABT3HYN6_9FLAO|nr:hypothetical protein [Chryseobacterium kimseyorum]MCW3168876.1 hypothetical protein [Chryseobacterium kimseyorum]